jgi:hypothetical protein
LPLLSNSLPVLSQVSAVRTGRYVATYINYLNDPLCPICVHNDLFDVSGIHLQSLVDLNRMLVIQHLRYELPELVLFRMA